MSARRRHPWLALALALGLAGGCPESDDPPLPADDDAGGDDDDSASPAEAIHEGDYGSLAVAPGGGAVFVRRIDDGDAWVEDEYGHRTRPRLLQIDHSGGLRPLSERAAQYLWFTATDGALYVDDPDGVATLFHADTSGSTTPVMDGWQGLRLDASGRFVFAQTSSPRHYTLFDTQGAAHLIHASEEQIPWHVTPDGACVTVGTPDGSFSLWRPATDDWTPLQFPDGSPLGPSLLFDSCQGVAYVRDDTVGWFDLADGVDHPLATVDGNLSGVALTVSPDEGHLYWVDDAGLRAADLADDSVTTAIPGQFAAVERSPDGRHLALAMSLDELGWCGPIVLYDLDAGTSAMTTGIVCYEIVGYTMFTPGGGHVLWTDGPFSGMVSPVPAWEEVSYCPPFECWHPGVVDRDDRWLVVPRAEDLGGAPGPVRVLSTTKLSVGAAEVTPFFESTEAYDYDWFEMVRFARDDDTLVFGHERVPHAEWEWPCPVELMAGSLSAGVHWSLAHDAVDVEIDKWDRLIYVVGEPRHEESCAAWAPEPGAIPALHVVPDELWM